MSMFTRNIRTIVQLGKSGVRWDLQEGGFNLADINKKEKTPQELLEEAKTIIGKMKEDDTTGFVDTAYNMPQLRSIMKELVDKNTENTTSLIDEVKKAAQADGVSADDKKRFEQLLQEWEAEIAAKKAKQAAEQAEIAKQARQQAIAARDAAGESRVVGMKEQATALVKILGITEKNAEETIIADLKDTNIQALLRIVSDSKNSSKIREYIKDYNIKFSSLPGGDINTSSFNEHKALEDLGYSPNGSIWFGGEAGKIKNFFEFYLSSTDTAAVFSQTGEYARAGLATTVAEKDKNNINKLSDIKGVVSYLSDVPNARYRKSDVEQVLNAMKDSPDFAKNIANIVGAKKVNDMMGLIIEFRFHPEYKARFFDAINTNGANQTVGLKSFLEGKGANKAQEKANEIQKIYTDIANKAIHGAEEALKKAETPEEKQKIQGVLDEYNKKRESWFTGEIRKVAEGAYANIGRNANIVGVGMTFETFIKGLTVSLGAGIGEGSIGAGAVVHYDIASAKLGETEKKIIEGNIGVGATVLPRSALPAFIPFVDGGLKATDKVQTFGMNGRGSIDSVGIHTTISKEGGVAMLSFMNERQSEMEQGRAKMMEAVKKLAAITPNDVNAKKFQEIVVATGLKATNIEVANWVENIKNLYARNPGSEKISADARAILLMGLVESEVEKAGIQEANNDTDARSFKGWSIGVGHILGVTFPVAGIAFKEGKMNYTYPDSALTQASAVSSTAVSTSEKQEPISQPEQTAKSVREGEKLDKDLADAVFAVNRDAKQYKTFNEALLQISDGKYGAALDALKGEKTLKTLTKKILLALGGVTELEEHPEKLATILTYTYGSNSIRNSGVVNSKLYNEARRATMVAESMEWAARWNQGNEDTFAAMETHTPKQISDIIRDQAISTTVFATPKGGIHRLDKYEGSILVSNKLLDVKEEQKQSLLAEHSTAVEKQFKALQAFTNNNQAITLDTYKEMLLTGDIPVSWESLGLNFIAKPQFFEARAMAAGNVCLNKVEGIAYPRFSYTPAGGATVTQEAGKVDSLDMPGGSAIYSETNSGVVVGGYSEKPKENTPEKPTEKPTTKPTENPTQPTHPPTLPPGPSPTPTVNPTPSPVTPSSRPTESPVQPTNPPPSLPDE